ncbi:MAG: flagellin, partial [Roseburia sp.]|nr:flagellin [Roseburia sp.]
MRINYNVSAAIANKHLLGIEDNLSTAMERLSSGLKINHSKDNPAGMAISSKMQAQIDGLDRASQNASDGISVIQIADGALNETTSILQRMRELSVQAASDATMTPADREAIQKEISSLKEEINRISRDTEYNSKTLLDGSLDTRVYAQHASRIDISDHVAAGQYQLEITAAATQPDSVTAAGNFNDDATQIGQSGTLEINGSKVDISETDTLAEVYEKIRTAAESGEVTVDRDAASGELTFTA